MNIGVPRERQPDEHRVGLTPAAVERLVAAGHTCSVEKHAGLGAGYEDVDYEKAGGRIVYSGEEAYRRADLVVKFSKPTEEEVQWLNDGAILMGFLHLAAGGRDRIDALLARHVTAIAYETIQSEDGSLPVQSPLSRLAGMMLPAGRRHAAPERPRGKGILLSGLAGLPPAEIAILGAGTFGTAAAGVFLDLGSSVTVLDHDLARLHALEDHLGHGRRAGPHGGLRLEHPEGGQLRGRARGRGPHPGREEPGGGDARHGRVHEAAQPRHGHRDRPGRLHRDEPADDAPEPHVPGGERHPLLRAEHDVGRRALGDRRC